MEAKEKQEALEWFVQFANTDLETIKPGDKAKLLIESEEYLYPEREELEVFYLTRDHWPEGIPKPKEYAPVETKVAKKYAGVMAWALEERPPKESPEYWNRVLSCQGVVKMFFRLFSSSSSSTSGAGGAGWMWYGKCL